MSLDHILKLFMRYLKKEPSGKSMLPKYCYADPIRRPINVKGVVIHYFSAVNVDDNGFDPENCRRLLLDLNREKREWYPMPAFPYRMYASYHAMIDREGKLIRLVEDDCVAYHAGESEYDGLTGLNDYSLGYALIGTYSSGFTDAQYNTLNDLLKVKKQEHNIEWITGHENVTSRKKDPGPKFDWSRVCGV